MLLLTHAGGGRHEARAALSSAYRRFEDRELSRRQSPVVPRIDKGGLHDSQSVPKEQMAAESMARSRCERKVGVAMAASILVMRTTTRSLIAVKPSSPHSCAGRWPCRSD